MLKSRDAERIMPRIELGLSFDQDGNIYVKTNATTIKVYNSYNTETPLRTITSSNFVTVEGMTIK